MLTQCTRGIQKVRRLTQLFTRYVHLILSLFNIVFCKWNAIGPAFLHSSNSVVEELSILLFQPTICHAVTFPPENYPYTWVSGPLSDTWFPGPTGVHTPNCISIGSAIFARLEIVTDKQTDRQTTSALLAIFQNNWWHKWLSTKERLDSRVNVTKVAGTWLDRMDAIQNFCLPITHFARNLHDDNSNNRLYIISVGPLIL